MSSSLNWFDGSSKEALQEMVKRNCAFLVYIGKSNEDIFEVFNDPSIIQLLNNELVLCYKMDPASSSFKNFNDIFNNVVVPSIYLLEKNNIQQYIIKKPNLKEISEIHFDLKRQMLKAIHLIIKNISVIDNVNINENKQKYVHYLTAITNKLQDLDNVHNKLSTSKVQEEVKKSSDTTKLKIKIPCQNVTLVQEFQSTSSLNDVKTFVLNNINLPKRSMKFIAHRQFTEEDFCQSLVALKLSPSSTVYVHMINESLDHRLLSMFNIQSWLRSIFHFSISIPYNFLQNYITSLFNTENVIQTKKKPTFKSVSNIHQLRNNKPDDDENNTYNGNSTQQL